MAKEGVERTDAKKKENRLAWALGLFILGFIGLVCVGSAIDEMVFNIDLKSAGRLVGFHYLFYIGGGGLIGAICYKVFSR